MRCTILSCCTALLMVPSAIAAQGPEFERPPVTDMAEWRGFIGMEASYGKMFDESGLLVGGHAALMLPKRFYAGLEVATIMTRPSVPRAIVVPKPVLDMRYAGAMIGYILPVVSTVQFTVESVVGLGSIRTRRELGPEGTETDWDGVTVAEPAMGATIQLGSTLRMTLSLGYRLVTGTDTENVLDEDISGITGTAAFRLGFR